MCLATVYREAISQRKSLYENIALISFKGETLIFTDVLNRKFEIKARIKTIDLTEGIIILDNKLSL